MIFWSHQIKINTNIKHFYLGRRKQWAREHREDKPEQEANYKGKYRDNIVNCLPKKSWCILYIKLLYKLDEDFLDSTR